MNKKLALLVLSLSTNAGLITAQPNDVSNEQVSEQKISAPVDKKHPIQATFIYPLGTGGVKSINNEYGFSLNIIGGNTGKISGTEIGGVYNIVKYGVDGVQIAGMMNLAGTGKEAVEGNNVQIAGLMNYNKKGHSAQISGMLNIGDIANFQAGGLLNISQNSNAQIAGMGNIAKTSNTQISGLFNVAGSSQAQITGAVNKATTSACQISGLVNVTGKGGFQLGVINVRDTTDGVSLGVVNIVKKGGILEFGLEAGEVVHGALTFRSGTPKLYSIISVGYNFSDEFVAVGFGLGTRVPLVGNRLALDVEGIHYNLYNNQFSSDNYNGLVQIRPLLNFRIANHFKIYAGPTLNLSMIKNMDNFTVPYSIWEKEGTRTLNSWVGVTGGVRF